jgi:hypothetical protein
MMKNEMCRTIEEMNADLLRDDVRVQWMGQSACLFHGDKLMAVFATQAPGLIEKIVRWLNKNCYRCTQIQNGKINL